MQQADRIRHIRENSFPLSPVDTGERPQVYRLNGIRAVVFDVYGTLFISGSGDISLAESEDRSPALAASLQVAGYSVARPDEDWARRLQESLLHFRELRQAQGIEFPEVRIQEVWAEMIENCRLDGWLAGAGDLELAIIDYECRINPCWAMPGLLEILHWLKQSNVTLGIVSNAQFYTPLLFPALLGFQLEDFGFREENCIWSYLEREGKPSPRLYRNLQRQLDLVGISPQETLYIGNDLRNDIWPAGKLGFHTALFAGDQRSLRWRSTDPDCAGVRPDLVLTDLRQIRDIV